MKATRKKRGRPRLDEEQAKSESILLRLGPNEKQGFADAATLAGIPLAVWMRERLRRIAARELGEAARPVAFLASRAN